MQQDPLKHLFKQEFSKMVAVISKRYGLQHIGIAEDIVGETFLLATETWREKGLPKNPAAWLYLVARQKTAYHFRRNKILEKKIIPELTARQEDREEPALNFSPENIKDSQLQMLFAICTPAIASEAQIGLALRILCGFGIDEIAEAFLSNREAINKRLFRAKEKLRAEKIRMELPAEGEISKRLDNVLHIIYLLFSEGYYSKTQNETLRKDLCLEALRLALLLTEYEKTNLPPTNALIALMCFHSSRFDARQNNGELPVLYNDQDETLWDRSLISRGIHYLNFSLKGSQLSSYHLEAKIAYWHCIKENSPEKWDDILDLYNQLLQINYSPSVALNRTYAVYKVRGTQAALAEAEKLQLINNHFYYMLLGELYKHQDLQKAKQNFQKAFALAKTDTDKQTIQKQIDQL